MTSTWAKWESLESWSKISNIIRWSIIKRALFNLILKGFRQCSRGVQREGLERRSSLSLTWNNGSSCGLRWLVWNRIIHIRLIKLRNLSNLSNARPRCRRRKREVVEQCHKFPSLWPKARYKANVFWSETSMKALKVDQLKYKNVHVNPKGTPKKSIIKVI